MLVGMLQAMARMKALQDAGAVLMPHASFISTSRHVEALA